MYSVSLPYLILTALCVPSDPTSARTHTAPALHFSDVYPSRGHILSFMYVPYFITIITRVVQYNMHVGLVFGRNNIFDRSRHHLTCTRCFMTRYVFSENSPTPRALPVYHCFNSMARIRIRSFLIHCNSAIIVIIIVLLSRAD